MAVHYNAFISYNHNPRDMKIAALLQQKLEHFRAPMRVQTADEIPQIKRVFLDKGELGVSMDLNEEIQAALQNSDYLIVICSPESMASIWVHREIGFFLKNHSVDRILTVITAGEPSEVLPEEILYKEVVDDDGTVRKEMREPLSCDYRLPVKKANKTELPRLVAAILGIRYDDLMQRQRHYRTVRIAAAAGISSFLMLIALGYFIWSNHQIRQNYENTMREQSRSLALQSEQALSSGDRLLAIEYALDALPSEDGDRPVVSDAVYALSSAVGVYEPPDDSWLSSVRSYYDFEPFDFITNDDGSVSKLLGASDRRLAVIDMQTGEKICTDYSKELYESGQILNTVTGYGREGFLLVTDNTVRLYDPDKEKERWNTDLSEYGSVFADVYAYKDSIWVPVSVITIDENYSAQRSVAIVELDSGSGEIKREIPVSDQYAIASGAEQSGSGRYIAVWISYYSDEAITDEEAVKLADMVTVFDAETGTAVTWDTEFFTTDVAFSGDTLAVCQIKDRPALSDTATYGNGLYEYNIRNRRKYFTLSDHHDIHLTGLSVSDLSEQWEKDFSEMCNGVPYLDVRTDIDEKDPPVYCTAGNILHVLDASGKETATVHFASPVMTYNYNGSKDVSAVLNSGQFAVYNMESGSMTQAQFFAAPVMGAFAKSGTFFIYSPYGENYGKYKTLQYTVDKGDPAWQEYAGSDPYAGVYSYEGSFIEVSDYLKTGDHVISRDALSGEAVWDVTLPEDTETFSEYYAGSGFDRESSTVVLIEGTVTDYTGDTPAQKIYYITIDAASGELVQKEAVLAAPADDWSGSYGVVTVGNGYIYLLASAIGGGEPMYVERVDIADGTASVCPLQDYVSSESSLQHVANRRVSIYGDRILIKADGTAIVFDTDGTQICRLADSDMELLGVTMFEGDIFALMLEGQDVHGVLFSADDGSLREDHLIHGLERPSETKLQRFAVERVSEDDILLEFNDAANLVSMNDWGVSAFMSGFRAYNAETGELYLKGAAMGHVPLRSVDELIELGREVLE